MKRLLISTVLLLILQASYAAHIKGGFFTYRYIGQSTSNPANAQYEVTLTVYMICSASPAQVSNPINFSIFDGNNQFIRNMSVSISQEYFLNKASDEPCITGNQQKCYYKVVVYRLPVLELEPSANGYTVAYQRCCRIAGIQNIVSSGSVGNSFSIRIPGTSLGPNVHTNSSPVFSVNDTAVVCSGSYFQYSFTATDPNIGDSLTYSFCNAQAGASQDDPAPVTATTPPYPSVPYAPPYNGSQPMGTGVTIDRRTGLISGVAPGVSGEYVVCVCVNEYKDGVLIGTTSKELHVEVGDCVPISANLNPSYITCDGFSWTFSNSGDQSMITSYDWFFGDPGSGAADSSDLASPTHVFSDTGAFVVTLIVNRGDPCADTATTVMKVYPGFFPDFNNTGICLITPVQFNDATTTAYGVVNSWTWNFGDLSTQADTSHLKNPTWQYPTIGPKDITLIATNSKGCVDTITKSVTIIDKPPITLAFKDTLICRPDAVQLQASGTGSFSWTPLVNIVNPNTATPTVSPTTTTTYQVALNEQGCINTDTVRVNVVSFVTLQAMADTTICMTDTVQLSVISDGLRFLWSPAATLNDPTLKNPRALPTASSTPYRVEARIGSCWAEDFVTIIAIPYPIANAGPDTVICYNQSAYLHGSHNGVSFTWSPTSSLVNPQTLNPTAHPARTTAYILAVNSDQGCPKATRDTVLVKVMPKIIPYAGNDTIVIVNQPLQFNAEGGVSYQWFPTTALNDPLIKNPVGIYGADMDSIRYRVFVLDSLGCIDSAFVKVTVFKTPPYVFVPTAFTPNNDGLNDIVAPIAVGVKQINTFSVFNRWGQLVFKTSVNGQGWDGRIKGVPQGTNVFVWMVSAVDYQDKPLFLKGTVTLIR
jgi:gliding motility-associated-like protein